MYTIAHGIRMPGVQLISIPIKYAATKMSSESIQGRPCALFMATRRYAMVFERPDSFNMAAKTSKKNTKR